MSRLLRWLTSLGLLLSAGCSSLEPLLAALTPAVTPTPVVIPTRRPTATAATPTPVASGPPVLRVWLPPQFDPALDDPEAALLAERLAEFESRHADLTFEVRIKKSDEENDIAELLSVTSVAAPGALPDLVLLSRADLEAAAALGLLHPIDGLSTSLDDPNWYGYAQELAHIQNTGYGLPFIGDALILVYYPELGKLVDWEDILSSQGQLVFPAGNSQGLVGLSLYASAGGEVVDAQGIPTLEVEALTQVLTLVENGLSQGIFVPSLANITNEAQTLQIYRTGTANKGIIGILNYRPSEDGAFTPLPGLEETPYSYANGWVWALAGSSPERQQLAVELAEFLVEDPFLAEWTRASGHLPARPSGVEEDNRVMTAVLESAHLTPPESVLAVLGPLMQDALSRVLNGEDAETVAASVVEKLK